jgi:hypothetical protein
VNNGTGVLSSGSGATVRIGDSTVTGNGTGLSTSNSGAIVSYITNEVDGNGADGTPSGTTPMK